MSDAREFSLVDATTGAIAGASRIGALAAAIQPRLPGDRPAMVAVRIAGKFDLLTILLALSQLEVCVVPLDPGAPAEVARSFLAVSGADLMLTDMDDGVFTPGCAVLDVATLLATAEIVGPPARFEAIRAAYLFFTSGSTGAPKGVWITAQMLSANVALALRHLPYEPDFVTASLLPGYHTFTLVSDVMTAFALATRCVVLPAFEIRRVDEIVEAIARHRVKTFSAVPVIFDVLARLGGRLAGSDVRFATSGAAPLTAELGRRYAQAAGHTLVPCYGMTEAVCFIAISAAEAVVFGSAGRPVVDLRIIGDDGAQAPPGAVGAIQVRGASVIKHGYFGAMLEPDDVYADGDWLRTGDLGYLDADGVLFVTGRSKNMIIRGGDKIYLEDIEALFETGTVAGVATGGDHRETFTLFFEEGRYEAESVAATIRAALGPGHLPDHAVAVPEIPRSPTGKLRRQLLAERWCDGHR